jgi:hypothetical protein
MLRSPLATWRAGTAWVEIARTHYFAPDGRQRPAKTQGCIAVSRRLLIRMRSQVQVLAGPPVIVAGQSAVGSKPGALAGCLGRAGAARPSPPASPSAPPGPSTRAAGTSTTTHSGRPPIPGTAASRPVQPPPVPSRSRRRRALRTPAWPTLEAASSTAAATPDPARVHHRQPRRPWVTSAASPASGPSRPSARAARGRGSLQGPGPAPVVRVALPHRPVPNATA